MRVQSIGQNNYKNRQASQNSNNQIAFKKNIVCSVTFEYDNAPSQLPKQLREAFKSLMVKTGIIDEANIVLNKICYWREEETNRGFLAILDRTSSFTKERFPQAMEKQYLEDRVIRKAYRRKGMLSKMPADLQKRVNNASESYFKAISDFSTNKNDPNYVLCAIEENTLWHIAENPHNIPDKKGVILTVPLYVAY